MVPASATATNAASWFIVNAGTPSALATLVTLAREPDTSQQGRRPGVSFRPEAQATPFGCR